ncbi:toll/interleukin-1 receptor domain-containing protein [Pararcticibacter amylolyticus]|nr:toll/interleukin-1 receptor domain-containing protein [Pararcticibacter amylolyticus]
MSRAFISYSHSDEDVIERLHTHLAVIKRNSGLEIWVDSEIVAGGLLDNEIEEALTGSMKSSLPNI